MTPLAPERLSDERFLLRRLTEADRDAVYGAASDPLIWADHPAHDRWQRPVFDEFFDGSLAHGGGMVLIDRADGAVIGHSRFDCVRACAGTQDVEIGWTFLVRARWGSAANAACKRLMVGHALERFDRAIFLVAEANGRSRRAMEKIGARPTPQVYDAMIVGRSVRHLIYAINRNDFAAGPLR